MVIPTGIAADFTNKEFFSHILDNGQVASFYDFENRLKLFPAVHSMYRFSLLTLCIPGKAKETDFAFFNHHPSDLRDERKHIRLSPSDFSLLNPNTRTTPIFRAKADGELAKFIYQRIPVLINKTKGENPLKVRFLRFFDMAGDSRLFRTREQLMKEGFGLLGNIFLKGDEVYLPLYEAKMFWHYDHRWGTYEGAYSRKDVHLPKPSFAQYSDPSFFSLPWYWVPKEEVEERLRKAGWRRGWLTAFRDITNASNERTAIFSVLPRVGVSNKAPLILFHQPANLIPACLGISIQ
jgi:hypothetical protein